MSGKQPSLPKSVVSAARLKSARSSKNPASPTANEKSPSRSPKSRLSSKGSVRNTSKARSSSKNLKNENIDELEAAQPQPIADTFLSVEQEYQVVLEPEVEIDEDPLVTIW